MKTKVLSLVGLFLLGAMSVFGQSTTEKFKVYGNCGMCEKRIETAAKSVDGVSKAEWDSKTEIIEVKMDESKTDVDKVQLAIAKVGHDTDAHKADDKTYNALHGCCKYERPTEGKEKDADPHKGHKH